MTDHDSSGPRYSVVVPAYESNKSLVELVERLGIMFDKTLMASYEVILVDDGSTSPGTWQACEELARKSPHVTAIRLMRNFGKPGAVLCGLRHAQGRWIITIDDDLQQRPEDIPELVKFENHDVVVAIFENRQHSLLTIATSRIKSYFDRVILRLPCKMSPLKLFKAEVARGMLEVQTPYPFIPALMAYVTTDFVPVPVEHSESRHGKSRYTLGRRLSQFSNLVISNSSLLLRWFGTLGIVFAFVGFAFAVTVIIRRLGGSTILPGWASLVVINLVFGGLILVALSIIGEYLLRILEGSSRKPAYLVREIIGAEGNRPAQRESGDRTPP